MTRTFLLALAIVGSLAVVPAGAVDLDSCGQTVRRGDVGVLVADVTCLTGPGVRLENGAGLQLNGFSLTVPNVANPIAVECLGRCSVVGPGYLISTSMGGVGGGVSSQAKGAISVRDIQINGFLAGIASPFARVTLANTKILDAVFGIVGRRIDVDEVTITGTTGSTCISGSGGRVRGSDVELTCDTGINVARSVSLTRLTNSGGFLGVASTGRITLIESAVTGASLADIASTRVPHLITGTTCDRSVRIDKTGYTSTWGVCAND